MFIVCPSCSGPYSIAADQIAPLVQVACPHCEYRVILDFEAANDPSLREPGHQFAQGYESAEAYFSVYNHVGKNPDAKPFASPGVTGAQAAELKQAVGASTTSPPTSPSTSPSTSPPTSPAKPTPASKPATGTAALGAPASSSTTLPPTEQQPGSSRNAKTVIHTGSKKPVPLDPTGVELAPRPKVPSGPTMRAGHNTEQLSPESAAAATPTNNSAPTPTSTVTPVATPVAETPLRTPPHTPPVASVVSSGPSAPETRPEDPASQSHSQLEKKPDPKPETLQPTETKIVPAETKSSKLVYIIIVLLILAVVVGLVLMNRP